MIGRYTTGAEKAAYEGLRPTGRPLKTLWVRQAWRQRGPHSLRISTTPGTGGTCGLGGSGGPCLDSSAAARNDFIHCT